MNHDTADDRWWPAGDVPTSAMRDADTVYAVLGPATTHRLIALHDAARDSGIDIDDDVNKLVEDLRHVVGTTPDMLAMMALSVALVGNLMWSPLPDIAPDAKEHPRFPWELFRQDLSTVFKLFGWQVEEMLHKFGFSRDSFIEYLENEWNVSEGRWPPATAPYTRRTPLSQSKAVRPPDGLGLWYHHWERHGNPTMIGAHWVRLVDLDRYLDSMRVALGHLDEDVHRTRRQSSPDEAVRLIHDAVATIERARDDIREAQQKIVGVFPT